MRIRVVLSNITLLIPLIWANQALGQFTAHEFLKPLHANISRPAEWPERLESAPENKIGLNQFKNLLVKTHWKMSYACDGRPVDAKLLASVDGFDGYYYFSEEFHFAQKELTILRRSPDRMREAASSTSEERVVSYGVRDLKNGRYTIESAMAAPMTVQVMRHPHAEEFMLKIEDSGYSQMSSTVCGYGPLERFLVRVPEREIAKK